MQESLNRMWEKLNGWWDTLILHLPNIVIAIVVFFLFIYIGKILSKYLSRLLKKTRMQTSVRRLIATLTAFLVILLGLLLAIGILNLNTVLKTLLAGAGIIGLAIGFALQGTLINSFAGVILAVQHYIQVGDWIESNNYRGFVTEINLRNTKILENDNNIVMIPNSMVIENPVKNHSLTPQTRVILTCGVRYDSPLLKVRTLVIQTILDTFDHLTEDKVEFIFTEFGDSSINFMLRYWINATENVTMLKSKSEAILAIKEAFDKEGIVIPFPIRTLEFDNPLSLINSETGNGKEISAEEPEA